MAFTRQYKEILRPEIRVGKANIIPRNIYRITTYTGGPGPITKTGDESRYIFVIGKVGDKIHCIKLNHIPPIDFTNFIGKLREKRTPIGRDQLLSLLLKKFSKEGRELYENYVKKDSKIYGPDKLRYRIYKLDKIQYVWEIRFEEGFLRKLFKEPLTEPQIKEIITDEVNEKDG